MSFLELEQAFYKEHFGDHVNAQNERNIKSGHKERNQTIEEYYYNRKTSPEDVIIQIGNIDEHPTVDELWACALKYKDDFDEKFGEHCRILTMALHDDEATPHVHIRRVWMSQDEKGDEYVNSAKARREMDIMLPNESKAEARFNNTKMTFTQIEREMLVQICKDEGLDIEPFGTKKKHLVTEKLKAVKDSDLFKMMKDNNFDIDEYERHMDDIFQAARSREDLYEKYKDELDEIDNISFADRAFLMNKIMMALNAELDRLEEVTKRAKERAKLQKEIEEADREIGKMEEFIRERGLFEEFENFMQNNEEVHKKKRSDEHEITTPTESFF